MNNCVVLHPRQDMWRIWNLIWRRPFIVSAGSTLKVDYREYLAGGKFERFLADDEGNDRTASPDGLSLEIARNQTRYLYKTALHPEVSEILLNKENLVPITPNSRSSKNLACENFNGIQKGDNLMLSLSSGSEGLLMAIGKVK